MFRDTFPLNNSLRKKHQFIKNTSLSVHVGDRFSSLLFNCIKEQKSRRQRRRYLHSALGRPSSSCPRLTQPRPTSELAQTQGREEIDNDIIYNVDHVCVKPDDGMRQINIKIFYKYTQPEYPRASQHPPARRSWSQSSVRSVCWARAVF